MNERDVKEHKKSRKVQMVCKYCGGIEVRKDAYAVWNFDTQCWELLSVFDYAVCEHCGGGTRIAEVEVVANED